MAPPRLQVGYNQSKLQSQRQLSKSHDASVLKTYMSVYDLIIAGFCMGSYLQTWEGSQRVGGIQQNFPYSRARVLQSPPFKAMRNAALPSQASAESRLAQLLWIVKVLRIPEPWGM